MIINEINIIVVAIISIIVYSMSAIVDDYFKGWRNLDTIKCSIINYCAPSFPSNKNILFRCLDCKKVI